MKGHSNVRWHSEFEQGEQIMLHYQQLAPFMAECEQKGIASETMKGMRAIVTADGQTLRLEVAASVDVFKPFVALTFLLEGDGVLVFLVTDKLAELDVHVATVRAGQGMPNTRAVARNIIHTHRPQLLGVAQDQAVDQQVAEQLAKVEPSLSYYESRKLKLKTQFDIFEACRLFDPSRAGFLQLLQLNEVTRQLDLIPFFTAQERQLLAAAWPAYVVYVGAHPPQVTSGEVMYEDWWVTAGAAGHGVWYAAAQKVMILAPSSAAAERVFSMLKALIGDRQMASALEDYQQTSIMLHFNQGQRYKEG
jgi:hypothetical protein